MKRLVECLFELGEDEFGVSPGFYIILDPLSDAPFYLVGGESPAEFTTDWIL